MRRVGAAALILGVIALAGWYGPDMYRKVEHAQAEDELWERARKHVSSSLFDPESAKFDCVLVGVHPDPDERRLNFVLGHVNAKNRLGGYAGRRSFNYSENQVGQDISSWIHDGPNKPAAECETSRFK